VRKHFSAGWIRQGHRGLSIGTQLEQSKGQNGFRQALETVDNCTGVVRDRQRIRGALRRIRGEVSRTDHAALNLDASGAVAGQGHSAVHHDQPAIIKPSRNGQVAAHQEQVAQTCSEGLRLVHDESRKNRGPTNQVRATRCRTIHSAPEADILFELLLKLRLDLTVSIEEKVIADLMGRF